MGRCPHPLKGESDMLLESTLQPEHLERAATIAAKVHNLPAVATQDWCDVASGLLASHYPGGICAVSIVRVNHTGEVTEVELSGCSGRTTGGREVTRGTLRPEGSGGLGWTLPGSDQREGAALLRSLSCAESFWRSIAGHQWWSVGVMDMAVGCRPMGGEMSTRGIVAEVGVASRGQLSGADAMVLRCVLKPLADRAMLAFGLEAISAVNRLTLREQEVLSLLTHGMSVKEIASSLDRSPHTVHDHVKALHRKLGASSRGELVARALGYPAGEVVAKVPAKRPETISDPGANRLASA